MSDDLRKTTYLLTIMDRRITFLALLAILLGTLSAVGKETDAYRKIIMEPTEVLTQFLDEALRDTQYAEKLDSVIIMMTSKVDDDGVSRYQFVFIQRGPQNIDDAIMKTTTYVRYRNFDIPIAFNIDDNGLEQNMLQDITWSQELQTFMCPKRFIIRDAYNYSIIKQSLLVEKRW